MQQIPEGQAAPAAGGGWGGGWGASGDDGWQQLQVAEQQLQVGEGRCARALVSC